MELTLTDIKVLRYLWKTSANNPVSNEQLYKKLGTESTISLEILEKNGYIECPQYFDGFQFGMAQLDNWRVTQKGIYYIKNYKAEKRLTSKERLFNYFLGFGSGLLSGCLIQLFIRLL